MSVLQQNNLPVIKGVYDPVTLRRDGIITPCAPILITGQHLLHWPKEQVEFFLCAVEKPDMLFPMVTLYKHTDQHILVTMPDLKQGKYQPVLCVKQEGELQKHYFPVTWEVKNITVVDIYYSRIRACSGG